MFPKLTSTTYFLECSNHLIICYHLTNWLWSHNCPAVISLLNCLCWVEWIVLSTTLFLTNSSMVNSYYGLYTKGSSQYFNLAWAYLTGVTLISLVWRKWFMPVYVRKLFRECQGFPVRFRCKWNRNLTFTSC